MQAMEGTDSVSERHRDSESDIKLTAPAAPRESAGLPSSLMAYCYRYGGMSMIERKRLRARLLLAEMSGVAMSPFLAVPVGRRRGASIAPSEDRLPGKPRSVPCPPGLRIAVLGAGSLRGTHNPSSPGEMPAGRLHYSGQPALRRPPDRRAARSPLELDDLRP
jgi:hypothetical protein